MPAPISDPSRPALSLADREAKIAANERKLGEMLRSELRLAWIGSIVFPLMALVVWIGTRDPVRIAGPLVFSVLYGSRLWQRLFRPDDRAAHARALAAGYAGLAAGYALLAATTHDGATRLFAAGAAVVSGLMALFSFRWSRLSDAQERRTR